MLKQLLLNRGRRLLLKILIGYRDWKGRRLEREVVIAETRLWKHRMKYEYTPFADWPMGPAGLNIPVRCSNRLLPEALPKDAVNSINTVPFSDAIGIVTDKYHPIMTRFTNGSTLKEDKE